MARLLSSGEVVALLLAHGFAFVSQKGSHIKYRDADYDKIDATTL